MSINYTALLFPFIVGNVFQSGMTNDRPKKNCKKNFLFSVFSPRRSLYFFVALSTAASGKSFFLSANSVQMVNMFM
jgi:hypothetical protein